MPQIQLSQVQTSKLRCRFEMTAADATSSHEFCVFDFPGCEGCPKAQHTVRTVGTSEDPMKSMVWRGWINGFSRKSVMESFIHRENLALFRKRLAEPRDEAERQVLLKLLGDEEAKDPPPKKGN
jgi:hypothetical protein